MVNKSTTSLKSNPHTQLLRSVTTSTYLPSATATSSKTSLSPQLADRHISVLNNANPTIQNPFSEHKIILKDSRQFNVNLLTNVPKDCKIQRAVAKVPVCITSSTDDLDVAISSSYSTTLYTYTLDTPRSTMEKQSAVHQPIIMHRSRKIDEISLTAEKITSFSNRVKRLKKLNIPLLPSFPTFNKANSVANDLSQKLHEAEESTSHNFELTSSKDITSENHNTKLDERDSKSVIAKKKANEIRSQRLSQRKERMQQLLDDYTSYESDHYTTISEDGLTAYTTF